MHFRISAINIRAVLFVSANLYVMCGILWVLVHYVLWLRACSHAYYFKTIRLLGISQLYVDNTRAVNFETLSLKGYFCQQLHSAVLSRSMTMYKQCQALHTHSELCCNSLSNLSSCVYCDYGTTFLGNIKSIRKERYK